MPIYEYYCEKCLKRFEHIQKLGDAPPPCPECGKHDIKKFWTKPALRFRGNGFYETDYKNKGAGS